MAGKVPPNAKSGRSQSADGQARFGVCEFQSSRDVRCLVPSVVFEVLLKNRGCNQRSQERCTLESVMNSPASGFCPYCGAAVSVPGGFCASCGQRLPSAPASAPSQPQSSQPAAGAAPQGTAVQCPFCHSTQVQSGKRGWKWTTGMIGSGKIVFTCLQCGKKFNPA